MESDNTDSLFFVKSICLSNVQDVQTDSGIQDKELSLTFKLIHSTKQPSSGGTWVNLLKDKSTVYRNKNLKK